MNSYSDGANVIKRLKKNLIPARYSEYSSIQFITDNTLKSDFIELVKLVKEQKIAEIIEKQNQRITIRKSAVFNFFNIFWNNYFF